MTSVKFNGKNEIYWLRSVEVFLRRKGLFDHSYLTSRNLLIPWLMWPVHILLLPRYLQLLHLLKKVFAIRRMIRSCSSCSLVLNPVLGLLYCTFDLRRLFGSACSTFTLEQRMSLLVWSTQAILWPWTRHSESGGVLFLSHRCNAPDNYTFYNYFETLLLHFDNKLVVEGAISFSFFCSHNII